MEAGPFHKSSLIYFFYFSRYLLGIFQLTMKVDHLLAVFLSMPMAHTSASGEFGRPSRQLIRRKTLGKSQRRTGKGLHSLSGMTQKARSSYLENETQDNWE